VSERTLTELKMDILASACLLAVATLIGAMVQLWL
jgi:hypothetical protein